MTISNTIQRFEEVDGTIIRARIPHEDGEAKRYLDSLIEGILSHRAVEHPFLNEYAKHGMNKAQERKLFLECFYFFQYLPFYIAGMSMRTRDELILRELILNVQDEVGDGKTKFVTHSTLYKKFLSDLGISASDIAEYKCLPTTRRLNDGIRELYTESDIMKGLGALYADETMSATMVTKLNEGLKTQGYGEDIRHFWMLHMQAEVGHSNSVFNAIFPYILDKKTQELFESGIAAFLSLVEAYWDGVEKLVHAH